MKACMGDLFFFFMPCRENSALPYFCYIASFLLIRRKNIIPRLANSVRRLVLCSTLFTTIKGGRPFNRTNGEERDPIPRRP